MEREADDMLLGSRHCYFNSPGQYRRVGMGAIATPPPKYHLEYIMKFDSNSCMMNDTC